MHDECYVTPYWGIAGLAVRDVRPRDTGGVAVQAVDAGVAATGRPVRSQWGQPHQWQHLPAFALLAAILMWCSGWCARAALTGHMDWNALSLSAGFRGGLEFDAFQRMLLRHPRDVLAGATPLVPGLDLGYASLAILFDCALIAVYGWILGLLAGWAFFRLAGWRHAGQAPSLLHRCKVGFVPLVAVLADILENLSTLAFLATRDVAILGPVRALLMAVCNCIKWGALLLSLGMVVCAVAKRPRSDRSVPHVAT
ncbi:hypothetical protein E4K72_05530 [Oxalobacteraceae bacterium OM1]|nr:hypothetical protein E4K72_05530 [Oxalobacteraceae bacterium OM1]